MKIQEASLASGWSPRMLRYIERVGLVAPMRSPSGYRVYGLPELERLRSLRALLASFDIELSDVAFAARMNADPELAVAVRDWLERCAGETRTSTARESHRTERYDTEALSAALA